MAFLPLIFAPPILIVGVVAFVSWRSVEQWARPIRVKRLVALSMLTQTLLGVPLGPLVAYVYRSPASASSYETVGMSGFIMNALAIPCVGVATRAIAMRREMRRRQVHPLSCPRCGYDLHGIATGRCPECGATNRSIASH